MGAAEQICCKEKEKRKNIDGQTSGLALAWYGTIIRVHLKTQSWLIMFYGLSCLIKNGSIILKEIIF